MVIEPSFYYRWLFGSWKGHEFTFRLKSRDSFLKFFSVSYLWMNFRAGGRRRNGMAAISVPTLY